MYEGSRGKKSGYFEGSSSFTDTSIINSTLINCVLLLLRYQEYLKCIETLGPKYLKLRSQKLILH